MERSLNMLRIHLTNFNSVVGKQISRYAFTKLSNIAMYYEIQTWMEYRYDGQLTDIFNKEIVLHNGISAVYALNTFLTKQMNQDPDIEDLSLFSDENAFMQSIQMIEDNQPRFRDMDTLLSDVNLRNDKNPADYFTIFSQVGQNLQDYYEETQNTPEFVLNNVKYDYVENANQFGLTQFGWLLGLTSELNSIRQEDSAIRASHTLHYLVPNIQLK